MLKNSFEQRHCAHTNPAVAGSGCAYICQQPLTAIRGSGGALSGSGQTCTALLAAGSVLAHVVGADRALLCSQRHLAVTAAGGGTAMASQGEALQAAAAVIVELEQLLSDHTAM
jgi:hypothetical protein